MNLPFARTADIVTQMTGDGERLIYDLKADRAFHLNKVSAAVLDRCNGFRAVDEIAADLSLNVGIVTLALADLGRANLVQAAFDLPKSGRRDVLRQLATASFVAALPMLTTVVAPTAVSAQSAGCFPLSNNANQNPLGCACDTNSDCSSNCCGVDGGEFCVAIDSTPLGDPCRGSCECAGSSSCPSCPGLPRICRNGGCP